MLAAEAQYCAMEAELQARLDNYEAEHDYDEYHYELDDIEHDPYVLISANHRADGQRMDNQRGRRYPRYAL